MDRLAWTVLSRVDEDSVMRRRITNELSNMQTYGFKRSLETAVRSLKSKGPGFDTRFQPYAFPVDLIAMEQGPMIATGKPLDIALENKTLMGVQAPNGELAFTRRGDLKVSSQNLLTNGSGHPIRGQNGLITIPPNVELEVTEDGSIFARDPMGDHEAEAVFVDRIFLRDASATRIMRREDTLLRPVPEDAAPEGDIFDGNIPVSVRPKTLEGANSSAIDAMIKIIDQHRTFEAQLRFIKEAKEIDENGVSMIKATG